MCRNLLVSLFLIGSLAACSVPSPLYAQEAPETQTAAPAHHDVRVALVLMPMERKVGAPDSVAVPFDAALRNEMERHFRIRLVSRDELPTNLQEIHLGSDGFIPENERKELGHFTGADYFVFPALTKHDVHDSYDNKAHSHTMTASLTYALRIISVKTAEEKTVLLDGQGFGTSSDGGQARGIFGKYTAPSVSTGDATEDAEKNAFDNALHMAGSDVLKALGEGEEGDSYSIVGRDEGDQTLIMDAGSKLGIKVGMEFNIFTETRQRLNNGSEYIKRAPICSARVISVQPELAVLQTGANKMDGFIAKHPVWHPDPSLIRLVTDDCKLMMTAETATR